MVDEADKIVKKEHGHRWYDPFFAFLRGTPPTKLGFGEQPAPREQFTRWEVFYQMEAGNWAKAATEADALNRYSNDGHERARQIWVDLAGRPGATKVAVDGARDLLHDAGADEWVAATGALATPEGQPLMERFLAASQSELKDHMRALWLTRCGKLEEGLNALVAASKVKVAAPPLDLAEIMCRPLISASLGEAVPEAVLARARTMGGHVPSRGKPLFDALAAGNAEDARNHARRLFELFPQSPYAALALARLEAGTGVPAEWPATRARLLAAVRARGFSVWILDGLRAADAVAVKRGAPPLPPGP